MKEAVALFGRIVESGLRTVFHRYKTRYFMPLFRHLDPETRQLVVEDAKRYRSFDASSIPKMGIEGCVRELFYSNSLFRALFYKRFCLSKQIGPKERVLLQLCTRALPPNPTIQIISNSIGGGLLINHGPATIGRAIIGRNVNIGAGVVIGMKNGGAPVIHDGVHISANAVVIGPIDVGENSIIGAGSVVIHDVPANTVVAGNPAKVLHEKKAAEMP